MTGAHPSQRWCQVTHLLCSQQPTPGDLGPGGESVATGGGGRTPATRPRARVAAGRSRGRGDDARPRRGRTEPTPLGGVGDSELDSFGVWSAIGVHFDGIGATPGTAEMAEVDDVIDDGDVTTGAFGQLAADRYDFVIQEVETVYGAP